MLIFGEDTAAWERLFHSLEALVAKKCLRGPVASWIWIFWLWPLVELESVGWNMCLSGQVEQWQFWSSVRILFWIM